MKLRTLLFALFSCAALQSLGQPTYPLNITSNPDVVGAVFTNATLQVSPQTRIDSGMLVIKERKILYAGAKKQWVDSADFVWKDAKGKFIYPGFIDPYTTVGVPKTKKSHEQGPESTAEVDGAKSWNDAIKPQANAYEQFRQKHKTLAKYRQTGISIVSTHIPDGLIRGTSLTLATGNEKTAALTINPANTMQYSFLTGSSKQDYPSSLMGMVALLRQTLYDAQWYAKGGRREEGNASLAALQKYKELPQIARAGNYLEVLNWLNIGDEFDMDFVVKTAGDDYRILKQLRERDATIITPVDFPKPYDVSDPDLARQLSTRDLRHWERAPFNPRYLYVSGVNFAFTANGLNKPEEFLDRVRKAYRHGLPGKEALKALTTRPAKILQIQDQAGTLEKGKLANFLITDGPLLARKTTIEAHYVLGKRYQIPKVRQKKRLAAQYSLNAGGRHYQLELEEKKDKFRATATPEDDSTAFKVNLRLFEGQVTLSFKDTTPRPAEYFSLSGGIFGGGRIWNGTGTVNAEKIEWSAIAHSPYKPEAITLEKPDSALGLPKIPSPLTSYGYDSLPQEETTLFVNATIWTNEPQGIIKKGEMLIDNGKILEVDDRVDTLLYFPNGTPDNFRIIDCHGRHITPGIIDEHSHIAIRRGVNESGQANTAEVRVADALNPADVNIYRQLAGGVTTSQLLHGSANPVGGQSAIIKLRWGQSPDSMLLKKAKPFIKFALGENVKQSNWGDLYHERFPQTRMGVEQIYYDGFWRAREYAAERKKHQRGTSKRSGKKAQNTEPFRRDLELEAMDEILRGERFITCHSYVQSEIQMLMSVADSMDFTVNTFTHVLEGYKIAKEIKDHGAAGSTFSDWWAYKYEVRDAIPYNAALMNQAGVLTAINSDNAEMGRRLNQEAAKTMKYGGLAPQQALKLVTLNPAKMLHIDEYTGSLDAGKDADFVIWNGYPLSLEAHPRSTFVDGARYFDERRNGKMYKSLQEDRARIIQEMAGMEKSGKQTQPVSTSDKSLYHCE